MPPSRPSDDPARRRRPALLGRLARTLRREDGNAALEFIGAGVLLLVPVIYLVVALGTVQAGALGVEGAARQAARVIATADSAAAGAQDADAAVQVTLADYGLSGAARSVEVACAPDPRNCLRRDGAVTVTVRVTVPLPLFPAFLGMRTPPGIPVSSAATQPVSRFRVTPVQP